MKYVIDADNELVALDMIELIRNSEPDVEVMQVPDVAALEPLRPAWSGGVFITSRPYEQIAQAENVSQFLESGGRVVIVGDVPRQEVSKHWVFLDNPFSETDFLNAIARALV